LPRGKVDVVVLGAGAAGLSASRALHAAGLDVIVLEARERLGGRVFTCRAHDTAIPVELGAEFIHGRAPATHGVLREAGLASIDVEGCRVASNSRGTLRPLDDFWEQLDRVMRRLDRRTRDRSFQQFLDTRPGGARLAGERALAKQWVEGFHAADSKRISARALAENGWPADDLEERRLGRVIQGYDRLIDWLAAPLTDRIHLSSVVARIQWKRGEVVASVRNADGKLRFAIEASAAVVAVPVGVLKAAVGDPGAIEFVPSLHQKQSALDGLETGSVTRVTLRLRERVWAENYPTLSFLHSTDEDFPVWWTAYPVQQPVVTGWRGGPGARRLAQLPPGELEGRAIAALGRRLGMSRRRMQSVVEAVWTHDWEHDPFARGAYSYQLVGGDGTPAALARPLRRTLFFAGEATDTDGATGTVEGAIASGRRAAAQVLRTIR